MSIMLQATTQSGADVAPARAPSVTVYTDGGSQVLRIPTTHEDFVALNQRRRELTDQLNSVSRRRDDLIDQMKTSPQAAWQGLQAQLNVLQPRIMQLENDLGQAERELAAAGPDLGVSAVASHRPSSQGTFGAGAAAFGVPIFMIMAAFYFVQRRRWMRALRRAPPALPSADSERLQRLENGMEAMAIEIERISEGQRFVTKLLSEPRGVESAPR
jgi:hypothetical protein